MEKKEIVNLAQLKLKFGLVGKISLISLILGILILLGWKLFSYQAIGRITTDQLSQRAQEFVVGQRRDGDNDWRQKQLTQPATTSQPNQIQFATPCFTLTLPYKVRSPKTSIEPDGCHFSAQIISPAARLAIWARPLVGIFQEDSGIVFRRSQPQIYQEFSFSSVVFDQVILFVSTDQLTLFALKDQAFFTYAFSEVQATQISDADLNLILNSTIITPAEKITPVQPNTSVSH